MLLLIPKVLNAETVQHFKSKLETMTFTDGKATALGSTRDRKQNRQLTAQDEAGRALGQELLNALAAHPLFAAATLPKQILVPMFARYSDGEHYGKHLDVPVMGRPPQQVRTDISVTVFLNDRNQYEGGELLLHVHGGTRAIKGEAGDVFVYPSSTVHEIRPVEKGERLVAVTWIQSLIPDPARRELVYDLNTNIAALEREGIQSEHLLALRRTHYNLLRMWADA